MERVFLFPMPVVAASAGHALAGGLMLYLAADLRIALDDAASWYGLPEVAQGVPLIGPTAGICAAGIPPAHHAELLLHGRRLSAREAFERALIHELAADVGALERRALEQALQARPEIDQLIHHSDRGVQLRFNGSSQRLEVKELRWVGAPVDSSLGPARTGPVYTLHVTLNEGIYHRYVTMYGVSFAGALLWMVGLPASYGSAELDFSVELRDPSGHVIGEDRFHAKSRATEWLYRAFVFAYTPAMPRAYARISPQLREFVSARLTQASHSARGQRTISLGAPRPGSQAGNARPTRRLPVALR